MDYLGVELKVVQADVFSYSSDLLVLKHAQASYGVDDRAAHVAGIDVTTLPKVGGGLLVEGPFPIAYRHLLFLGVEPIGSFNYRSVRDFSRRALSGATGISPPVREISMTLHGVGFGLDETEAFESEVAGIVEAIDSGSYPRSLLTVSIIEQSENRVDRMRRSLVALLDPLSAKREPLERGTTSEGFQARRIDSVGYDSAARSHAFVAMPFSESFEDVFYYGIAPPVRAAGLLCERMDQISFTGDIVHRMKDRISSAAIVVADLSEANPNVYLEIGYAWGVRIPCILICNRKTDLKFDLQGQRCLFYGTIMELEKILSAELIALSAQTLSAQIRLGRTKPS
jgi:hypothetical protein